MSPPEEIRRPCIGCGAMNPAEAKVCAGCGHRLREPAQAPEPPGPPVAPDSDSTRRTDDPGARPITGPLRRSGRVVIAILIVLATVVAAPIAFVVTCATVGGNVEGTSSLPVVLGGLAAVAIVSGAGFLIYSLSRSPNS